MASMFKKFKDECENKTIPELQELITEMTKYDDDDGHTVEYYSEDEGDTDYDEGFHYEENCKMCICEKVLRKKQEIENSTLPGNDPHYYLEKKQTVTSKNVYASDLKEGMVARFFYAPGNRNHYYVEVVNINISEDEVLVGWKKTNSDEEPFTVTYNMKDNCEISELHVIGNK